MFLSGFLIGLPFFVGFMMSFTRRGIDGSTDYPNWEWGVYWRRGWKALAINLVYYVPLLALFFTYFAIVAVPLLIGEASGVDELAAVSALFGMFGMIILYACMFVYAIFFAIVQMATAPVVALDLPVSAGFQFKHYIWPYLKANVVNLVLAWLIGYLAGLVSMVGMIFLFVGMFLTMPLALAITAYANGVVYRNSSVKYNVQH